MKRFIITILIGISITANANDSLKIIHLQREVSNLKVAVSQLRQENGELQKEMQSFCLEQKVGADSLSKKQELQADGLNALSDKISSDLTETNTKIDVSANVAACGIFIAFVLLVIIYLMLRNKIYRGSSSIDKIKVAQESLETAQKSLQEESVKLDGKLVELLDKQLKQNTEPKQDHSFVLDIANEIARIEQNLAFMDTKVKGVSNLKNRAAAINDRLKSKGYEIPKLVGEKYIDGNNMKPTMELDEDLPAGTQIIRRVLKPMVIYNGEMIQAAEVVVAYNE